MAKVPKAADEVTRDDRPVRWPASATSRSTPSTPRRYHHGDLRAALLVAAEEELGEVGLAGFSLRGTARRAQVSHAAPAHHFANADAVLTALADVGFARLADRMERDMQAAGDAPQPRLATAGRAYIAFAQAHPQLFRLMFFGQRPRHLADDCPDTAPSESPSGRAFGLLRRCVEALIGPSASEATVASGIAASWGLVHGISHLLIEDAMGFLAPLDGVHRQAVIDEAIHRLVTALDDVRLNQPRSR